MMRHKLKYYIVEATYVSWVEDEYCDLVTDIITTCFQQFAKGPMEARTYIEECLEMDELEVIEAIVGIRQGGRIMEADRRDL